MSNKNLIIVESPSKIKTLKKFLDKNYQIEASVGHIRDLPSSKLGIDLDNNFNPTYVVSDRSKKVVKNLKSVLKSVDAIYIATDPDREGEAIAWHLLSDFSEKKLLKDKEVKRITFNEITSSAIKQAINSPREIDQDLVDAYLARRILDHLIGFKVSPLVWRHAPPAKSAGRVQSPSLRIICERETERDKHIKEEYWPISSKFEYNDFIFDAELIKRNEEDLKKNPISSEKDVREIESELKSSEFFIKSIETKPQSSSPNPPFRTSTLQMTASSFLGFTADRTMRAAQNLYEAGLITYLRTDGINISTSPNTGEPFSEENPGPPPLQEIRNVIVEKFGDKFLSDQVRVYKSKVKNSQEAHEAIRPTNIKTYPDNINLGQDEQKLYTLIWNRTVSSQMSNSQHERKKIVVCSKDQKYVFNASSRKTLFEGFETLSKKDSSEIIEFPENLKENENVSLAEFISEQKFTSPPNRYSEASLIKKMEELGIGRPSTYASTVKGLRDKKYAYGAKSIAPSDLGRVLNSYLSGVYKEFFIETKFTAELETELDKIAEGSISWTDVLDKFWEELQNYLSKKIDGIPLNDSENFKTRQVLDLLNEELEEVIFPRDEAGKIIRDCPKCDSQTSLKKGKFGYFVGCSECKWTKKPFDFSTTWETYKELPKELGNHPDLNEPIFADMSINGPCVWTMRDDKKIFGSPDEDENILDIGLNRAVELIERDSGENILFIEENSGIPIFLKNGRFGEYTEFDGFNKASKLPPEDKPKNPKVSYYNPHELDYENKDTRLFVLKSLRVLGFHPDDKRPIGIKIRKPGKAFKFVKFIKCGEKEVECPNDFYKLEEAEQDSLIKEAFSIDQYKKL